MEANGFKLLFPGFKRRAVTFSYDDGVRQDVRLTGIFNKYHLKATFNLNSGCQGKEKHYGDVDASRLNLSERLDIYKGFEITSHTLTHPHLEERSLEEQLSEYQDDIEALESLFGQKIIGSAYPYGTYDLNTINVLEELGIKYARTTQSTHAFHRPYDFLLWHPTAHHGDPLLFSLLKDFKKSDEELPIFYVWGHAYEFDIHDNWHVIEDFCKDISKIDDLFSATNGEICEYVKAASLVYLRNGFLVNPSSKEVFLSYQERLISIPAFERTAL